MKDYQMGAIETKFADIIWENEPIATGELVKKSEEIFGWKKSTTYTVLKRLCEKGIFKNEKSRVYSLISKAEFCSLQSERFVEQRFAGSLPAFFAAFTARKKISAEDMAELRRMIDEYKGD